MAENILIPYNYTINDDQSIDFVRQKYGSSEETKITLFHAYSPVPVIDTHNNPIMEKIIRQTSYLRALQKEHKNALLKVRQEMINMGLNGDNINCIFAPLKEDIVIDIIRLAESKKINAIVLNRNPGNILNYFIRSTSKRLIQYFSRDVEIYVVN